MIVKRNAPFYSLTMLIPIVIMTLLTPLGLMLNEKTSDKYYLQVKGVKFSLGESY